MVHIPKFNAVLVISALASLVTVSAVPITQPFEGNGTGRTTHLKVLGGNIGAGALPSSGLRGAKAAPSVSGAVAAAPSTVLNGVAPSSSVGLAASQTSPDASFIPSPPTSVAALATETVTQTLVVTVSSPPLATVTVTLAQVEPQAAAGGVIDGVAGGSAGAVAAVGNTPTLTSPVPNLPAATPVAATGPKRVDTPRGGSGPKLI
ncbi:hypothetical protein PLEOSDRAFT_1081110 [Pleurotus ostreatus PC15]|uniref:Uncharacterized protein n=1 Tax=Pleurotus ostreatus (strain PC15) TaxID=1137138 RepID=A0A067PCN8_PLEO1|nr:hypothetical protein PLEOSDRAFT_1081110 [Pleurotus ostreatus PC15]